MNEANPVAHERASTRDRMLGVAIQCSGGGAFALLLAQLVLSATGHSNRYVIAVLFLVESVILMVGFGAFGGRAMARGRRSDARVAFASFVVWVAFAAVQVVILAS
ncbi:MAG: hypothetical protein V4479_11900 [Actinomycetota bacterium]